MQKRALSQLSIVVAILIVPVRLWGQSHSINADLAVEVVSLEEFEGLEPEEAWDQLNELEFWAVPRQAPSNYYAEADVTSAATLRASLHEITRGHLIFPYTHSSRPGQANHRVDTWDIIALADAHPAQFDNVLDLYLNDTFDRQLTGSVPDPKYDREHSWPKSYGFSQDTSDNAAFSDCHHLFAAYNSYNGSRGNKPYGSAPIDPEARRMTMENLGRGGSLMDEPESSNYSFPAVWQTWIGRRGDAARAMFYMDVRYEGGTRDGVGEPDLKLTDNAAEITEKLIWSTSGTASMGLLKTLLEWHQQDPVDDLERRRNTVVYLFQGNRNPFIDHPEWVSVIFGGASPVAAQASVWINEFHYDNTSADTGEFVEIAGRSGQSLSGWKLVGYNGAGGREYKTVELSGVVPNQANGCGVLAFDFPGLQNGAPDGIALIAPDGNVIQFISYEGQFTATDGPAKDTPARPITISETDSTPAGSSVQMTGAGCGDTGFSWTGPNAATRGQVNAGQTFTCP